MTEKHFAKGICFTSFPYKGYTVNLTVRDGGRQEAEDSLLALMDIINDVIDPTRVDAGLEDVKEVEFGEVTKAGVMGLDLGLLKYAPKASELKPGQVFEVTVNQYKLRDGEIVFGHTESKYPIHTHKLNDYGVKVMAKIFTDKWDSVFIGATDYFPIPKGDLIIKIECSQKTTDQGNPYRNLVGQRRP